VRPLEAVFDDATALYADAAALMRRARGLRQELKAATASGVKETERLVHGATVAGIETGLVQGWRRRCEGSRKRRNAPARRRRRGYGSCWTACREERG
jgi:hypothetical protein